MGSLRPLPLKEGSSYRDLDINPFTNPALKNKVIEFVYDPDRHPFRRVFHRVFASPGIYDLDLSNAGIASGALIGSLTVGGSVSLNEFTTADARVPGGGLATEFHSIPESVHMFDLGYWDGKPYPVNGAAVIYLPKEILARGFTREQVIEIG